MEQSLRLLLTSSTKPTEQTLLNVYNKLSSQSGQNFSSDLFILTAERFFDLPRPLQKHIVEKAENMVLMYDRLQEPINQFGIRSMIIHSLIYNYKAQQLRGEDAIEMNTKAIDYIHRALKGIQATTLYSPLSIRAVFIFYQIAAPFFSLEMRHHIQAIAPLALQLLEPHLTEKFDNIMRLYITLSLLTGCIYDDLQKSDDATKQIQKVFTMIPADQVMMKFSLLHIITHFSRKSPGGLSKAKFEINEQLQKAIILYQAARSNNQPTTKDLAEAFKICQAYFDSKRESGEESQCFEILVGEIGRTAAQFQQTQLAKDCQAVAQSARNSLSRLHAILIGAELALTQQMTPDERADIVSSCSHAMSVAQSQGDIVLVQDSAAMLWSHCVQILNRPGLIKRHLIAALEILSRMNCQTSLLRSQMHFALAKIFEADRDSHKALDNLRKAMSLDYVVVDHPTHLQHPFDRFLVPFWHMLSVVMDPYGQHTGLFDQALAPIAQSRRASPQALKEAQEILNGITKEDAAKYDAVEAAHFAGVWCEVIKTASMTNQHEYAVNSCKHFLEYEFEPVQFDAAVEIQCETVVYGITSVFKMYPIDSEDGINFLHFAIQKGKILKMPRLQYNALATIWNVFFSSGDREKASELVDVLGDCVNALFEINLDEAKNSIGQYVNLYVSVLLDLAQESNTTTQNTASGSGANNNKKKPGSLDPNKQKQLKTAEDITLKSLPLVKSIYEKKALVDRLVDIFGRKNALPPNNSDVETSVLIQLATIMNEKVQHKQETLTTLFNQIGTMECPALYSLLSERANKLDLCQLTIDSATKMIEAYPNPDSKDIHYHVGLARFNRGSAFQKLIQPDLQEFSCQDKLRIDAANDFLRAAVHFDNAKSTNNAKLALSYFCSTISVGEFFPDFRSYISDILLEAINLSKRIQIGDDQRVRLYRIYLRVLIDQSEWSQCRRAIHEVISTLDKSVHCHLWELNLIVTANYDCTKNETPLIDEMLRVKQLGDSKYQSRLWTFVSDLAKDPEIQRTALNRAYDVLKPTDVEERFTTSMNLAKWHRSHNAKWDDIETVLNNAIEAAMEEEREHIKQQRLLEINVFKLKNTKSLDYFNSVLHQIEVISTDLWDIIAASNAVVVEEEQPEKRGKQSARGHKNNSVKQPSAKEAEPIQEFGQIPNSVAGWLQLMSSVEKHKAPEFDKPYTFVEQLMDASEIFGMNGLDFNSMIIWYIAMLVSKQANNARLEQLLYLKFRILVDHLNVVSTLPYNQDFSLTEEEKSEWSQKVKRYQEDPPSDIPPLRRVLIKQAELLVIIGEYRDALVCINSALTQADQLKDDETSADALRLLGLVKARSGDFPTATDLIKQAGTIGTMELPFWIKWFTAAIHTHRHGRSAFVLSMLQKFTNICNESISVYELIGIYELYKEAVPLLVPVDAIAFYKAIKKSLLKPTFLPSAQLRLTYLQRMLLSVYFPTDIVEYRDFGHEVLSFIEDAENMYMKASDNGTEESTIPWLVIYVETINLFGELVIKYYPQIQKIMDKGLDYDVCGSHDSIINDFIDKEKDPLPELSPTAAVLLFNGVQCLDNIPAKSMARLNLFLGQCLHIIATDNVTLQNSVKYLWKCVPMFLELEMYEHAGDIAIELVEILKDTDVSGAISMFLLAQNSIAYERRVNYLKRETPSANRELLFVLENQRIRSLFMKPQLAPMFVNTQKFFSDVPSGMQLLRSSVTIDDARALCQQFNNMPIVIIDTVDRDGGLQGTVITFGETDTLQIAPLNLNLDTIESKVEVFKQIIAPPPTSDTDAPKQQVPPSRNAKKKKQEKGKNLPLSGSESFCSSTIEFAKNALKSNNPEFSAFVEELLSELEPLTNLLNGIPSDTILYVSSIRAVHRIPFSALPPFQPFTREFHDYSVNAAIGRKGQLLISASQFE